MAATLLELEVELLLASASSLTVREELVEHVFMRVTTEMPIGILTGGLSLHTFLSMLIVDFAFFRVRENLIGIRDLLELLLRSVWVILVFIRMILNGQLFELLFNLLISRPSLKPHGLIVVLSQDHRNHHC